MNSAFCAATSKDITTSFCWLALQEAMILLSFKDRRLVSSLCGKSACRDGENGRQRWSGGDRRKEGSRCQRRNANSATRCCRKNRFCDGKHQFLLWRERVNFMGVFLKWVGKMETQWGRKIFPRWIRDEFSPFFCMAKTVEVSFQCQISSYFRCTMWKIWSYIEGEKSKQSLKIIIFLF